MANYSVDSFIGKHFFAKSQLIAFYGRPLSNSIFVIPKGAGTPAVTSYVKDPENAANVYWVFTAKDGQLFYVRHDPNKIGLSLSDSRPKSEEQKKKEQEDETNKDEKGAFIYYFEKYGKIVHLSALGFCLYRE